MVNLAQMIAATSSHKHFHHSVVVELGGEIVGFGSNGNTRASHAEANAINHALRTVRSIKGARVWSFRVTATGKLGMAKPCPTCEAFLRSHGVSKVYWSNQDGGISKRLLK